MFRVDFKHNFNYINILKTNIIKMKTLILGTLLILAVSFFGCDNNPVNPVTETKDNAIKNGTLHVLTNEGTMIYKCDRLSYSLGQLAIYFKVTETKDSARLINTDNIIYYETFK